MTDKAGASHPLYGANLNTLWQVWRQSGGLAPGHRLQMLGAFGAALGRLPFSVAEKAYVAVNRQKAQGTEDPIFILGHWRSGTTHLYNTLSKADHFAYVSPFATALPWDFLLLGRALRPLLTKKLPEHRYIDRIPVEATSPQEDEIALANMTPLSFYHGLYFPKQFEHYFEKGVFFDGVSEDDIKAWQQKLRYLYLKLALDQPGKRLLIKNPVYTARPKMLLEMWPNAKFIHIHRNPVKVFLSMRNFYAALFKQFAMQTYDGVDIDEIILRTYARMMTNLQEETKDLPKESFIELRYDDLQDDPIAQITNIYNQLALPDLESAMPAFEAYLTSVKNFKKNRFSVSDDVLEKIKRRWRPQLDQWGYHLGM